jgi:excisionase family DNA binding protein
VTPDLVIIGCMNVLTTRDHGRDYLTVAQVACELHCSEPTVQRRIRSGQLPAVHLGHAGTAVRVRRDELEAWLTPRRPSNPTPRASLTAQ